MQVEESKSITAPCVGESWRFKMFKSADKMMEELGFEKLEGDDAESRYGACYQRTNEKYHYVQRLDILHKASSSHLIQSYVAKMNSDGFNDCVGLTYKEMKAAMKKYRELKRKYRW